MFFSFFSFFFYWVLWYKLNKELSISDAWKRLELIGSLKIRFNFQVTSIHPSCILSFQLSFQPFVTENWLTAVFDSEANCCVCVLLRGRPGRAASVTLQVAVFSFFTLCLYSHLLSSWNLEYFLLFSFYSHLNCYLFYQHFFKGSVFFFHSQLHYCYFLTKSHFFFPRFLLKFLIFKMVIKELCSCV